MGVNTYGGVFSIKPNDSTLELTVCFRLACCQLQIFSERLQWAEIAISKKSKIPIAGCLVWKNRKSIS